MTQRLYAAQNQNERYAPIQAKYNREKTTKMNEIDNYITILIENNRSYGEQLNQIRAQNVQIKGQIEIILREKLLQKEHLEEEIKSIKGKFSSEVNKLVDELRDILVQKQQMEASYKVLIEELSNQTEAERQSRYHQIEQIKRNHQSELLYLNQKLADQSRESEKHYYLNSENKIRFVQEIDALNYEINECRKKIADLNQENKLKNEEITKLAAVIKVLSKEKDEIGMNVLKVQQDKNQSLMELKKLNCSLRNQMDVQIQNMKMLEIGLANKEKEYYSLKDRNDLLARDLSALEDYSQSLAAKHQEQESSLKSLKAEYSKLAQHTSNQIKRMNDLIKLLEVDNTKLFARQEEVENQNSIKQQQIYTLLDKVQKLEKEYETIYGQLQLSLGQANHLAADNSHLSQSLQLLELQLQNEQQKTQLQLNNIHTLEMIIQKQKKRNAGLQMGWEEKENISKNIPQQALRRYEDEVSEVIKRVNFEKIELKDYYEGQRQQIIASYERALREKQASFKQKMQSLERDVLELSRA